MPKHTSEMDSQPELASPDEASGVSPLRWSRRHDAIFVLLTLASVLLLLALFSYSGSDMAWSIAGEGRPTNAVGKVGAVVADILFHGFGYLAFALPLLVMAKLGQLFRRTTPNSGRVWVLRLLGITLSVTSLCALAEMSIWHGADLPVGAGGILGRSLVAGMLPLFSFVGSAVLLTGALAIGMMLFLEFSWLAFFDALGGWMLGKLQAQHLADKMAEPRREADSDEDISDISEEPPLTVEGVGTGRKEKARFSLFGKKAKVAAPGKERLSEPDLADDILMPEWDSTPAADDFNAVENIPTLTAHDDARDVVDVAAPFNDPEEVAQPAVKSASVVAEAPSQRKPSRKEPEAASSLFAKEDTPPWEDDTDAEPVIPIQPLEKKESRTSERAQRDLQGKLFNADEPLPSIALLDPPRTDHQGGFSPERLQEMSKLLVQKLADFGVKIEVTAVAPGPVITRFEIQPAPGVKASKISNLARDLARSMAMVSVRVVEVIPGKSVMGIEVPNENRAVVSLSEVLSSEEFDKSKSPLTLALGHDIGGNPIITDLAKMPHLLVAGTTGSGKSVGVNAMLISLLFKSTPDDLRLILVDPKMLELSVYEGIPHLLTPVITDMKEAANGLRWSVAEMERRYMLMAAMGVRNIAGYNKKVKDAIDAGQPIADPLWQIDKSYDTTPPLLEPLPYIVIVIDEFADMMMMVGKKVEELIARIAQKARAAGIHMVLATQRPSVDVITGLIKANVPTRIAFQVSSKIDSRTILDQGGAEQLLGHGDMLYMPPGNALPERVHGAFVDDDEVHRVVAEWKKRGEPQYIEEITSHGEEGAGPALEGGDEKDDLYDQAVAFVTETGKCSISSVQRKLRIGYNRAARLVETMEASGVVSPPAHNGSREVLAGAPPDY